MHPNTLLPISLILKNHPSTLFASRKTKTEKQTLHIALRHSFRSLSFSRCISRHNPSLSPHFPRRHGIVTIAITPLHLASTNAMTMEQKHCIPSLLHIAI
jgi:hypothetical protein